MEWSDPGDDAWEDPLDLGMPGEPEYPPAPLPAHERRWRHPSEVGHAAWVQSERQMGVGRGLLVTTGAIGCVLGLALVWMMVPSTGPAPSADPTVARSDLTDVPLAGPGLASTSVAVAPDLIALVPTVPPTTAALVFETVAPSVVPVATAAPPETTFALQLPAEEPTTNTVWLKSPEEGSQAAVAVVVGSSPYLITTASAVGTGDTVRVVLDSGGVTEVPVVEVVSDFAFIQSDESLRTYGFADAVAPEPGESLTVLDDEQIFFLYGDETLAALDPATVAEGTPVVNESGALVGLCTGSTGELSVVPIVDALEEAPEPPTSDVPSTTVTTTSPNTSTTTPVTTATTTTTPATTVTTSAPATSVVATTPGTAPVSSTSTSVPTGATTSSVVPTSTTSAPHRGPWMGVRLGGEGVSAMTISAITPGSPAAAAGLVVGEEITAIDGTRVTTVDELLARLDQHAPGDTIVVTVLAPKSASASSSTTSSPSSTPRAERQVSVVLAENERTL